MASGPWIRTDATRGSLSLPGVVTEPGGSAVGELTVTSCCEWPLVVYTPMLLETRFSFTRAIDDATH